MTSFMSHTLFKRFQLFSDEKRAVEKLHATSAQAPKETKPFAVDEGHVLHVEDEGSVRVQGFCAHASELIDPSPGDLADKPNPQPAGAVLAHNADGEDSQHARLNRNGCAPGWQSGCLR
jgi:hypothetical protein